MKELLFEKENINPYGGDLESVIKLYKLEDGFQLWVTDYNPVSHDVIDISFEISSEEMFDLSERLW